MILVYSLGVMLIFVVVRFGVSCLVDCVDRIGCGVDGWVVVQVMVSEDGIILCDLVRFDSCVVYWCI